MTQPAAPSPADVPAIRPQDAARLVADGTAVLIDVREPIEWNETGVAAPARLLAKSDFEGDQTFWSPFLAQQPRKQLILYCRSGKRASVVGATLAQQGWSVANAGGFTDWLAAELPTRSRS